MDREAFAQEVEIALSHLRDVVYLRTAEMGSLLFPHVPSSERGWELSRYLLEMVERLRPKGANAGDWPHRRYELLALRYVNGLTPEQAAARLLCSRRHFHRQLRHALDDFASFLWAELGSRVEAGIAADEAEPSLTELGRLELLRQEAAPLLRSAQSCSLLDVWQSAEGVLSPLLAENGMALHADLPAGLPAVSLSPQILKQLLLALLDDLVQSGETSRVSLAAQRSDDGLILDIVVLGDGALGATWEKLSQRAAASLAVMHGALLQLVDVHPNGITCRAILPIASTRAVLVVEDNEEVCLLFRRYLASGGYEPLLATSGAEAISLATSRPLYAVTLDLMMSNEDGWDVLQSLRHDPRTENLPVIVCTVLDHQELALLMGASAFLKKPVMREQLLQALDDLAPTPPAGVGLQSS